MLSADSAVSCVNAFADKVSLTVELSTRCYNCLTMLSWACIKSRITLGIKTKQKADKSAILANIILQVYHTGQKLSRKAATY